jgi:hypothetical protein
MKYDWLIILDNLSKQKNADDKWIENRKNDEQGKSLMYMKKWNYELIKFIFKG